ncbi:MAG: hypothetical protein MJ252_00725 [archaeon]|nr:hypothetical protein [archaeon]
MNTIKVLKLKNKVTSSMIFLSLSFILFAFISREIVESNYEKESQRENLQRIQKLIKDNKSLENIIKVVPYLLYDNLILLIMVFEFNKSNSFKTFVLFNIYTFSNFLSGFIQLVLGGDKPYMKMNTDIEVIPYNCQFELGFGASSPFILSSTAFYLSLYKIYYTGPKHPGIIWRIICLIPFICLIFLGCFFKFLEGNVFIGEILFSLCLGIGIFIFVFFGLNISYDDGEEFCRIINHKIIFYVLGLILFSGGYLIPFFLRYFLSEKKDFNNPCYNTKYSDKSEVIFDSDNAYKSFILSNLCLLPYLLGTFFSFVGAKIELHFTFKENIMHFTNFNFDTKDSSIEDYEVANSRESISITKESKWNNTGLVKTTIRLVAFIVLTGIIFSPFYIISSWKSFGLVFGLKYCLTQCLISICFFFLFKLLLAKTEIINKSFLLTIQY